MNTKPWVLSRPLDLSSVTGNSRSQARSKNVDGNCCLLYFVSAAKELSPFCLLRIITHLLNFEVLYLWREISNINQN